jgi:hypothetical protein
MSDITYIFLQMLLLLAYGCYVAYRVGFSKGQATIVSKNTNVFKSWKEIK